jgi:hypothetical protein
MARPQTPKTGAIRLFFLLRYFTHGRGQRTNTCQAYHPQHGHSRNTKEWEGELVWSIESMEEWQPIYTEVGGVLAGMPS